MALSMVSCAHVVSKEMREKADVQPPVQQLFKLPGKYVGRTVILGGTIINSVNADDGTYIEVLEAPLDGRGRPLDTEKTRGRFLVFSEEYLETAIYATGRRITVAGEVMGSKPGTVGEAKYIYLLIRGKELHLSKPSKGPSFHIGIGVYQSF